MKIKIALVCVIFVILYVVYIQFANNPFLFKNFWRSYYYTIVCGFPLVLLIYILPSIGSSFSITLILSTIIFLSELIIFNLLLINAEDIVFRNYCTSKAFEIIFLSSLGVLFLVSFIIKLIK